jgi:hypothetical protein
VGYHAVITCVLAVHFLALAYIVFGGFLSWRWPRAFWPHLVAAVWGVLVIAWLDCPLTWAENWARRKAGEQVLTSGFIDRYIENVVYPERYVNEVRALCALVVVVSWVGGYLLWRKRASKRGAETARH